MSPLPDPAIVTTGNPGSPAKVSPQGGMQFPVTAPADPTGKMTVGSSLLCYLPQAAYGTVVPAAGTFSTMYITNCTYDATVASFQGGSSPTITFLFDRLGADGNWYPILPAPNTSGVVTVAAAVTVSIDIGLIPQSLSGGGNTAVYGAAHNVFTPTSRVRWVFGGTPATVTFSMSLYGR